jgi:DNA polymerase epsilon subunit 1
VGLWFSVQVSHGEVTLTPASDMILQPSPKICAFDIECSKAPLKFPDAETDAVYMISYMLDSQGHAFLNYYCLRNCFFAQHHARTSD